MQLSMLTGTIITVVAVLLFVIMLILLLVMVDHKSRIPGEERKDLLRITGIRKSHPIWMATRAPAVRLSFYRNLIPGP